MLDKNRYIIQLEIELQNIIKSKLISYYKEELELGKEDIEIELEMAMNSRLIDLEDTIDINQLINKK